MFCHFEVKYRTIYIRKVQTKLLPLKNMATESRDYYYSQKQANGFAFANQTGGRTFMTPRLGMAPVKTVHYYSKSYYNGNLYTDSVPVGELPDKAYNDWVLVATGPTTGVNLTNDLY